jgi:hypothetical protein
MYFILNLIYSERCTAHGRVSYEAVKLDFMLADIACNMLRGFRHKPISVETIIGSSYHNEVNA